MRFVSVTSRQPKVSLQFRLRIAVADAIRSSLGPKGMDKMVGSHMANLVDCHKSNVSSGFK